MRSAIRVLSMLLLLYSFNSSVLADDGPAQLKPVVEPIVNGLLEWNLPSVIALIDEQGNAFCTGTLIGCQTVLTAAHCFCEDSATGAQLTGAACSLRPDLLDPTKVFVFSQHAGVFDVASVSVNPSYKFTSQADLAVLRLADSVTGLPPSPLNLVGRVGSGTQGVIAGFGRVLGSALAESGLKRSGLVVTAPCSTVPNASHVCWNFTAPLGPPGFDSNTCQGDSGGPLFVVSGGSLKVAGVTSGGPNPTCLPPDQGFQADSFIHASWIQSQFGADTPAGSCGPLPNAGSANAPVLAGSGVLRPSNADDRFVFDVPTGLTALLVALNGDSHSGDADLYLAPANPPSPTNATCSSEFEGSFETCAVIAPTPGPWHVLAQRFGGTVPYQLTVTLYSSGAPTVGCTPSTTALCLNGGRFRVEAAWQTAAGQAGLGQAVALTSDTGYFWFFSSANVEVVIKVLNACGFAGKHWVFAGGLTDQQVVITVTDTLTDEVRTYVNPQGRAFEPIQDTGAFATCP